MRKPQVGDRVQTLISRYQEAPIRTQGIITIVSIEGIYIVWDTGSHKGRQVGPYFLSRFHEGILSFVEPPDEWADDLIIEGQKL